MNLQNELKSSIELNKNSQNKNENIISIIISYLAVSETIKEKNTILIMDLYFHQTQWVNSLIIKTFG